MPRILAELLFDVPEFVLKLLDEIVCRYPVFFTEHSFRFLGRNDLDPPMSIRIENGPSSRQSGRSTVRLVRRQRFIGGSRHDGSILNCRDRIRLSRFIEEAPRG